MPFARKEYDIRLIDNNQIEGKVRSDLAGTYQVLTAGTGAVATIYVNDLAASAASNPGTISNGQIKFFMDDSITSVDISIYTSEGDAIFLRGVTPDKTHRAQVDKDKIEQTLVIGIACTTSTETTTGFTFVGPVTITDIELFIETVDATETLDVGVDGTTTNDPDGLIDGVSLATAGSPEIGPVLTSGSNEVYISASTRGVLLSTITAGSDATEDHGTYVTHQCHIGAAETDANITISGSSGADTAVGYLLLTLKKLPA
jgi:hypothetical protein